MANSQVTKHLPEGFITLNDALNSPKDTITNLLGVVQSVQPPKPSRGPDWIMTVQLKDPSESSFSIRYFAREANLPRQPDVGDVLLVRSVKMTVYARGKLAITNITTSTFAFPAAQIPAPAFWKEIATGRKLNYHYKGDLSRTQAHQEITLKEQYYVVVLKNWATARASAAEVHTIRTEPPMSRVKAGPGQPVNTLHQPGRKFSLIKDIRDRQFCDLVVQVVKIFSGSFESLELYVTDYTTNHLLFDTPIPPEVLEPDTEGTMYQYIPDQRNKWRGPYGKHTLQIKVWEPHAHWVRNSSFDGDIILIRNVHVKYIATGYNAVIAGALHQDRKYPAQVDVQKVDMDDARAQALEERREKYWLDFDRKLGRAPKSKNKKRRRKNKAQNLANASDLSPMASGRTSPALEGSDTDTRHDSDKTEIDNGASATSPKTNIQSSNPSIGFMHSDMPISSFDDILDVDRSFITDKQSVQWPYTNQRVHARIRVLDYFPSDITQFSQPVTDVTATELRLSLEGDWAWLFYILVADASSTKAFNRPPLVITVCGAAATKLLKMAPCNLASQPQQLAALKERLFHLWGNAEELKSSGIDLPTNEQSCMPFECGLYEYGALPEGESDWSQAERTFGLFGTTIKI